MIIFCCLCWFIPCILFGEDAAIKEISPGGEGLCHHASSLWYKLMKMLMFAISKLLSFPSWCLLSTLAPAYFWLQRGHSASWPVLVCGLCSDSHLCCFPGAVIGPSVRLLLALMCFQTRALERTSTWKYSMSVSLTVCILILVCTCLFSRDLLCRLGRPWACLLLLKGKWSRPQTSYETELIRYEKWFSVSG